jgi:hypothetical protein
MNMKIKKGIKFYQVNLEGCMKKLIAANVFLDGGI